MTFKTKIFHDELKNKYLQKLILKFYNNLEYLDKSTNFKNRLNIIFNILNIAYNNYNILPYKLKLVCYDKCIDIREDCKLSIEKNYIDKSPWYKKHNKSLKKIIDLCNKIAN